MQLLFNFCLLSGKFELLTYKESSVAGKVESWRHFPLVVEVSLSGLINECQVILNKK